MGAMWYRARVDIAERPADRRVWLWIGATEGKTRVFVNGVHVQCGREPGREGESLDLGDEPSGFCVPLVYDVTDALAPGQNVLAILTTRDRVNEVGIGGLLAPVMLYCDL
ncbi:MAG: hypothetical protein GX174_04850 [Lentisphaerae bacterium]|jgi:hypothetical protein|nr:hypothetical protein [Lentisphaerota bacterium]